MRLLPIFVILLIVPAMAAGQENLSPYLGQEGHHIKSLSESEVAGLLAGHGLGLAKAAELNHYPGPKHVLEMTNELSLSSEQSQKTQAAFDAMLAEARRLGALLVQKEASLDSLFSTGSATEESVRSLVRQIAELQGELRFTHLKAHLQMRDTLNHAQIMLYVEKRGYKTGDNPHHKHEH